VTVKIVTDSCSDVPQEEAGQLGIAVVPVYLRFGGEVYRDGVDIDSDELYRKLATSSVHPSTAAPSPGDFARVYEKAAQETDEIVSIHIGSKLSATYDAAMLGKEIAEKKGCRIEVIDSKGLAMWQGLVAIAAAEAAKAGYSLNQVVDRAHEAIRGMRGLALLDTARYAVKGGRIVKVVSAIGSVLHVKLLLTLSDGEIRPAGLVRTRRKGIARLLEFTKPASHTEDLAIVYNTTPVDAQTIADHISPLFPNVVPRIVRMGPALCVHFGPGVLGAVLREAK
jgi:DegV family protein with EDD domain